MKVVSKRWKICNLSFRKPQQQFAHPGGKSIRIFHSSSSRKPINNVVTRICNLSIKKYNDPQRKKRNERRGNTRKESFLNDFCRQKQFMILFIDYGGGGVDVSNFRLVPIKDSAGRNTLTILYTPSPTTHHN